MSIKAKSWEGGGAASVPDASETTKGKIRIATTTESNAGTDDLTAMTPAKVKARIDAALVGGVEYKGQIAVSAFSTLLNANQGDMYKISTGGTAGDGRTYEAGDTIIVNADMGGTFADSKLDKIDNTEIISSVNGQTGPVNIYADDTVLNIAGTGLSISGSGATSTLNADSATTSAPGIIEIATNTEAQTGSAADKALVPSNLGSIGTSQLNNDAGFITSAGVGNQITDIEIKTGSTFTAEANHLYICGYTSGTQTITFPDGSSSTTGDIIGLSTQSATRAVSLVSSDGTTNDLLNNTNDTRGGTNGALSLSIHRQVSWFVSDGALWLEMNAALKPVASTGAYSDLSGTPTVPTALNDLSDVTITSAGTGEVLRYSGSAWVDAQLAYSDLSGTPSLATVATTGAYSDLSGTPSLATVATTGAYSDLSGKPTVPSGLNDLSDVTITSAGTGEVLRYSGSAWVDAQLAYSDLSGTPSLATVATTGAYSDLSGTPSLATVATTGAYSDLSGKPTVPSGLNDLSDVTITSAGTGEVLRYSGSAWVDAQLAYSDLSGTPSLATVATSGAYSDLSGKPTVPSGLNDLSDVTITGASAGEYLRYSGSAWVDTVLNLVDDTSPQLGGDLDLNNNKLTTASNGNIELTPHGTGHIKLGGNTNSAEVRFFDEAGTNYIALKAPADADISGDYTLTLPVDDGTADQVLKTDGSGVLSWTDQSAGGGGGYTYSAKTASFSAAADYHYSCTNAITATLPAASSNANKSIRIKVMGTDTVTIGRNGSDKIDGVASDYSMTIQYSSITLFSNGSDGWEII